MLSNNNIKGIPSNERVWVRITGNADSEYLITSKTDSREYYFLYQLIDGKAKKLGKAKSPLDLERKYITY